MNIDNFIHKCKCGKDPEVYKDGRNVYLMCSSCRVRTLNSANKAVAVTQWNEENPHPAGKEFTMKQIKNGYILKDQEGEELAYVEGDDDLENFASFLRDINEHYGPEQSKWTKQIRVVVDYGSKVEEDHPCVLCGQKIVDEIL